jgi:hypothetical protein
MWPAKHKFIQTPEAVYILHELGPCVSGRVAQRQASRRIPIRSYWGHSIGWYENGDTLVVDTIGTNDRTLLDQMGHPHTEQLHLVERYKRVNATSSSWTSPSTIRARTAKPWTGHRNFRRSDTGFLRFQWVCSVRDNNEHFDNVGRRRIRRYDVQIADAVTFTDHDAQRDRASVFVTTDDRSHPNLRTRTSTQTA